MRVYVASSWRNNAQPLVVETLRTCGFEVYDFRHPAPGNNGFAWSDIDPGWQRWSAEKFVEALDDPIAVSGFEFDMDALHRCDACVLVMPCGRSAHLELGYAVGAGKKTVILLSDGEPELMYRMADVITSDIRAVVAYLGHDCEAAA